MRPAVARCCCSSGGPRGELATPDPKADPGCEHPLKLARQKLYDSLAVSNLTVHSIDPRGLENIGDHTKASVSGAGFDRPVNSGPRVRLQQLTGARNDMLRTQESLRILPDRTGGRTVVNTNAPDEKIPEIFRESEAYYLLGFERDPAGKADATPIDRGQGRPEGRTGVCATPVHPAGSAGVTSDTGACRVERRRRSIGAIGGLLPHAGTPLALSTTAFAKAEGEGAASASTSTRRLCRGCPGAARHHRVRRRSGRPPGRLRQANINVGREAACGAGACRSCGRADAHRARSRRLRGPRGRRRPEDRSSGERVLADRDSQVRRRRLSRYRTLRSRSGRPGFAGRDRCARVDPSDHTTPVQSRRSGSRVSSDLPGHAGEPMPSCRCRSA